MFLNQLPHSLPAGLLDICSELKMKREVVSLLSAESGLPLAHPYLMHFIKVNIDPTLAFLKGRVRVGHNSNYFFPAANS